VEQRVAAAYGLTLEDRRRPVRTTCVDVSRDGVEDQGQPCKGEQRSDHSANSPRGSTLCTGASWHHSQAMTTRGTVSNRSVENTRRLSCDLVDDASHGGTLQVRSITNRSRGPTVDQLICLCAGHLFTYQFEANITLERAQRHSLRR
jgi:hypothetical protein